MFSAELPMVSNLYCATAVARFRGAELSATGLGDSLLEAEARRDAELAEGKALLLGPAQRRAKTLSEQHAGAECGPDWSAFLDHTVSPSGNPDCACATELHSSGRFALPMDALESTGPGGFAQGVAAGPDREMALRNALLETVERYASANWWHAVEPAKPPAPAVTAVFGGLQKHWFRRSARQTGLLDITPDIGLPVFAAWSCRDDGRDLCFGTACGVTDEEAVRAALKELFQMEFGLDVVRYRQRHGVELARKERVMLARASRLNLKTCKALIETLPGAETAPRAAGLETVQQIARHAASQNRRLYAVDLNRPDTTHWAVRVISPDLEMPGCRRPKTELASSSVVHTRATARWSAWELY